MKMLVLAAIITSIFVGQFLRAHVKLLRGRVKAIAWPRKRYCVRT